MKSRGFYERTKKNTQTIWLPLVGYLNIINEQNVIERQDLIVVKVLLERHIGTVCSSNAPWYTKPF